MYKPATSFEYFVIGVVVITSIASISLLYFLHNLFLAFGIVSSVISFNLVLVFFLVGDDPLSQETASDDEYKY